MAPAVLRRAGWIWAAAALAALAVLLVLALRSPDRQQSLVAFQAAGTMRHIAAEQVRSVQLAAAGHSRRFERGADGHWLADGQPADARSAAALQAGLRLLHNTPPERDFDTESPEFGLSPPALLVTVLADGGQTFELAFGAANPMGLAQYVRIRSAGQTRLHLMPGYLAEAWAPALPRQLP